MVKDFDGYKKRLDELEFLSHKTQRKSAQYDEIQRRVSEFDTEKRVMEAKIYQEIHRININAESYNEKIIGLQGSMSQFVSANDNVRLLA